MNVLVGAVAGGGGTVLVRVVRAELFRQRTQVQAWDQERAEQAAAAALPQAASSRLGEAATFQVPAPPARPVVVEAVVVDQAPGCAR